MVTVYLYENVFVNVIIMEEGFSCGSVVKTPPANAGDTGLIFGLGRSPGGRNGNPLQYSCLGNPMDRDPLQYFCLGNPMDRGAWWVIVHVVTKSQT